jgi:hypothetical protein
MHFKQISVITEGNSGGFYSFVMDILGRSKGFVHRKI